MPIKVGFIIFPDMQLLDLAGPYELFTSSSQIEVHLIGETLEAVTTTSGITFQPTMNFNSACQLDILCVPGGKGVNALLENQAVLNFVINQAKTLRCISSVCTGALVLGAAGLLMGKKATTHWTALEFLADFGAIPSKERVVLDGNIMTAGGVTAGIDFGLVMIAQLLGEEAARTIQLFLQYDPQPPFDCGTPEKAPQKLVENVLRQGETYLPRKQIVERWKQARVNPFLIEA
ncbi:DJ-1/PfpI family protein [Bartonella sp. LJL80]